MANVWNYIGKSRIYFRGVSKNRESDTSGAPYFPQKIVGHLFFDTPTLCMIEFRENCRYNLNL